MIKITLPDGTIKEFESGVTAMDVALSISEGLARNVLSAKVNGEVNIINEKLKQTLAVNKKLMEEVSEKDKLLHVNEQKMVDYEVMINKIQEEASKELTEKERFSMLT
jgi:threonyl-tRNA synthetase